MYQYIKRILDIILGIITLILLSPIMIITSVLIRIDSKGPIIFKQQRVGKDGKHFTIYKFRTMVENAEKMGTGLDSYENDTRVTKIGKFLRNSSLDEFPQLFNILKGDMSFVGPRPQLHTIHINMMIIQLMPKEDLRLDPELQDMHKINGRNELSWEEKFKYDLYYVDKVCLLLDLKIFILTIFKVIKMEGSYDLKQNTKEKSTSLNQ